MIHTDTAVVPRGLYLLTYLAFPVQPLTCRAYRLHLVLLDAVPQPREVKSPAFT